MAAFCTAQNRLKVRPKAWKKGRSARKTSPPSWSIGTQAIAWFALARRLRWVSMAALGVPVVPPVYSRTATSSAWGSGAEAVTGACLATSRSQERTVAGRAAALPKIGRASCRERV